MKPLITSLSALFLIASPLCAEIRLPALISDHAMFQADKPIAVWGWAEPGARLKVAFLGAEASRLGGFDATADAKGKWAGQLPPLKSGAAGSLQVSVDRGEQKTVSDVLVGEVWLGGGQSNMEYVIAARGRADLTNPEEVAQIGANVATAQKEAEAANPRIRYFRVATHGEDQPADDVKGKWVFADSKNVADFSAVAWNFGIALQNKLHVPIGLVVSCVGNTPVETWMSRETLEGTPAGVVTLGRDRDARALFTPEAAAKYNADLKAWKAANPTPELQAKNRRSLPLPSYNGNYTPCRYYNGMIRGLEPFALRGVIWFHGDGNMAHASEYSELFRAMIKEWRHEFNDELLPFYFVEINNMREPRQSKPVQPNWLSLIREQQHGALSLPGVGAACSIDLGNKNPHFPNKKPVGERLANLALRDCYGQPAPASPIFKSFAVEGNKVRLSFTDAAGLRVRGGGELAGFAIRGGTGGWVWAKGEIVGNDIVLWNDAVGSPAAVRYGWAMNPVISVENEAGLPLFPFRTDTASRE